MKQYNNDEKTYYYIRNEFIPKNNLEIAFRFYYLRKTCFRGLIRYNKSGEFNVPFGHYKTYNFEELLNKDYIKLLQKTEIYNKDFNFIFDKYNNENNFVFLDPPYDDTFDKYKSFGFTKENHIELFNQFSKTKNKCLMIIGETDFIKGLYKDYIIEKYHKKYSITNYTKKIKDSGHLIIKNY